MDELENAQPVVAEITQHVIPIILHTLQSDVVGEHTSFDYFYIDIYPILSPELYDSVWELADTLTFRARAIVPEMWPVYQKTYELFKSSAVDYLEGGSYFL